MKKRYWKSRKLLPMAAFLLCSAVVAGVVMSHRDATNQRQKPATAVEQRVLQATQTQQIQPTVATDPAPDDKQVVPAKPASGGTPTSSSQSRKDGTPPPTALSGIKVAFTSQAGTVAFGLNGNTSAGFRYFLEGTTIYADSFYETGTGRLSKTSSLVSMTLPPLGQGQYTLYICTDSNGSCGSIKSPVVNITVNSQSGYECGPTPSGPNPNCPPKYTFRY